MSLDPRTPVLVGYGQVNQYADPADAREPVALMAEAARAAADPRGGAPVDVTVARTLAGYSEAPQRYRIWVLPPK